MRQWVACFLKQKTALGPTARFVRNALVGLALEWEGLVETALCAPTVFLFAVLFFLGACSIGALKRLRLLQTLLKLRLSFEALLKW